MIRALRRYTVAMVLVLLVALGAWSYTWTGLPQWQLPHKWQLVVGLKGAVVMVPTTEQVCRTSIKRLAEGAALRFDNAETRGRQPIFVACAFTAGGQVQEVVDIHILATGVGI